MLNHRFQVSWGRLAHGAACKLASGYTFEGRAGLRLGFFGGGYLPVEGRRQLRSTSCGETLSLFWLANLKSTGVMDLSSFLSQSPFQNFFLLLFPVWSLSLRSQLLQMANSLSAWTGDLRHFTAVSSKMTISLAAFLFLSDNLAL